MAKKKNRANNSKSKNKKMFSTWHAVPLKGSLMATAMMGFFISAYYVFPQSFNYGIAFMFLFTLMFIAAIISMTKAPIVSERYQ